MRALGARGPGSIPGAPTDLAKSASALFAFRCGKSTKLFES